METPKWIDEKQVSAITGISIQTLRNWRFLNQGIHYSKIGRMVRYRWDDVIRFMEDKRINIPVTQ